MFFMKNPNLDYFQEVYAYLSENPPTLKELFHERVEKLGVSLRQIECGLGIERKSLTGAIQNFAYLKM